MFAKIFCLFAALSVANANGLISAGSSAISREQDSLGNYAFRYDIASAGSKRSRAEIGNGHGLTKTAYAVADSHLAPAAATIVAPAPIVAPVAPFVAHPAPILAPATPIVAHPAPILAHPAPFVAHPAPIFAPAATFVAHPAPIFAPAAPLIAGPSVLAGHRILGLNKLGLVGSLGHRAGLVGPLGIPTHLVGLKGSPLIY